MSSLRVMTVVGLLVGAVGIAILWSAGVPFPFYPPPGIVILAVGALVVVLIRRRWSPIVGAALGLFVVVGFLISPTGTSNLLGDAGSAVSIGSGVQLVGVIAALVFGVLAARAEYRTGRRTATR
jgi:hypothetical protein